MIKGTLLWDYDGTLATRYSVWSTSILQTLDELWPGHGIPLQRIQSHPLKRLPWHEPEKDYVHLCEPEKWWGHVHGMFVRLFLDLGLPEPLTQEAALKTHSHVVDASRYQLFADVSETLSALSQQGWRHAVLSNNYPELPQVVTHLFGGHSPFDFVFTSSLIGYEKPRVEIFKHVLSQLEHKERVWMIGDNVHSDIAGADAAGLPSIHVRSPKSSRSRLYANDFAEVQAILASES